MTSELATLPKPKINYDGIDRAKLSDKTRAQYKKALRRYLDEGHSITDSKALTEYAEKLPVSSKAFLKAAVRLVTQGTIQDLKANVTPDTLVKTQAALMRLESLNNAIQVDSPKGKKIHTWLSPEEVKKLLATCDNSLAGRRDWIVLACLVGAGLRREELHTLTFTDLKRTTIKRGETRWVLQVKGKGSKDRSIPIKKELADSLNAWRLVVGEGRVARSLGRNKKIKDSLSVIGIFKIVRKHGELIGRLGLDPHDLRRTYAQIGYDSEIKLTQISTLLGHSNLQTTGHYLDLATDLETTISDFIPL